MYAPPKDNLVALTLADGREGIRHVFIRDLVLEAEIGVHAHEKGQPQEIRVNVDLAVADTPGGTPDQLDAVVCYETVADAIRRIVKTGHVHLVETLAERIADAALEDQRVLSARVRVEKLHAIEGAASVGVEIERLQDAGADSSS